MSVKHYGIYLAYAPTVDLRHEGLGRYLAAFLQGAADRNDVRFVLVCPSWSREGLQELFASEGLPQNRFEIYTPNSLPLVLRGYEAYQAYKERPLKLPLRKRFNAWARAAKDTLIERIEVRLARAHSFSALLPVLFHFGLLAVIAIFLSPLALIAAIFFFLGTWLRRGVVRVGRPLVRLKIRLQQALRQPKEDGFVLRLYRQMEEAESTRMLQLIKDLPHVRAWYSPTAFWPAFNEIEAPRLMCVPDVVLGDFPVGFANVGGDRFFKNFQAVEDAILGCSHFVTYSEQIKRATLVDRYAMQPDSVYVVHHAPNTLSQRITVTGFPDNEETSKNYCMTLFKNAMLKSFNPGYTSTFMNGSARFLFYASQFRPNKNILSLLRAYEYLLRRRFIGHKLILTGNPTVLPEVNKYILEHQLENEVLCLSGLSVSELAACYRLADVAVNPSLSEGGCPFTFTEALSLNTPVVMAKIPVTMEVLDDSCLEDVMFFDPYDWKDMAARIEWAVRNRDALLAIQKPVYERLVQRTWRNVVDEHIAILDKISMPAIESEVGP